jgi:hypothetical protein
MIETIERMLIDPERGKLTRRQFAVSRNRGCCHSRRSVRDCCSGESKWLSCGQSEPCYGAGLQGVAGTGKTTALDAIRLGAEQNGYQSKVCPTSRATHQLRDAGIAADTLQGFLARGIQQTADDPTRRHLYMVDESSLASTKLMREFLDRISPNNRILLIGNTRQHQVSRLESPSNSYRSRHEDGTSGTDYSPKGFSAVEGRGAPVEE